MLVTTRMILFVGMLAQGPPAAGAFVCLTTTLKEAAMEAKVMFKEKSECT